jgi:hypothetical protein
MKTVQEQHADDEMPILSSPQLARVMNRLQEYLTEKDAGEDCSVTWTPIEVTNKMRIAIEFPLEYSKFCAQVLYPEVQAILMKAVQFRVYLHESAVEVVVPLDEWKNIVDWMAPMRFITMGTTNGHE